MIKILSIGNSFSEDSTKYLHKMAVRGNIDVKTVNLYIGGCSLFTHWQNAQEDNAKYDYHNGESTGEYVSIKQALLSDSWDYVTLQQASYDSGVEETYFPYLTNLSQYRRRAPSAVQLILKHGHTSLTLPGGEYGDSGRNVRPLASLRKPLPQ